MSGAALSALPGLFNYLDMNSNLKFKSNIILVSGHSVTFKKEVNENNGDSPSTVD